MTVYVCPDCRTRTAAVRIAERDVRDAARRLARSRRDDPQRLRDELADLKQTVRECRENLELHEAECTFVPEAARPIRGVRQPKPKVKKPASKVAANRAARVPDRSVLLAAIAAQPPVLSLPSAPEITDDDARTGPIAGQCARCERALPPGRRLCGRCYALGNSR